MACEFYVPLYMYSTNILGTSCLAFCTTLGSQWYMQKPRRHRTPGPLQAEASYNGDTKGKTKNYIITLLTNLRLCKHQCMTAITMVWPESSWAFPESCDADSSGSEHSSNVDLSCEVHVENANGSFHVKSTQENLDPIRFE